MPRVRVVADDGWIALDELIEPEHLQAGHDRRCLAVRIAWAVEDAARREARPVARGARRAPVAAAA